MRAKEWGTVATECLPSTTTVTMPGRSFTLSLTRYRTSASGRGANCLAWLSVCRVGIGPAMHVLNQRSLSQSVLSAAVRPGCWTQACKENSGQDDRWLQLLHHVTSPFCWPAASCRQLDAMPLDLSVAVSLTTFHRWADPSQMLAMPAIRAMTSTTTAPDGRSNSAEQARPKAYPAAPIT